MVYIAKDKDGSVYLYDKKPIKIGDIWCPADRGNFFEISEEFAKLLLDDKSAWEKGPYKLKVITIENE